MKKDNVKQEKSSRSLVADLAFIILMVLLIVLIFRIVSAKIKGEIYFLFNKYTIMWVLTESMEDVIPAESYILVEKATPDDVGPGDIITFKSEDPIILGELNTHRIVEEIDDNGLAYVTKGDHNNIVDNYYVHAENLVGKYVCNLSIFTFLTHLFSSAGGIAAVAVVIFLMAGLSIFKIVKSPNKEKIAQSHDEEMQKRIAEEIEKLKKLGLELPKIDEKPSNDGEISQVENKKE